jgi:hypothetical protein
MVSEYRWNEVLFIHFQIQWWYDSDSKEQGHSEERVEWNGSEKLAEYGAVEMG